MEKEPLVTRFAQCQLTEKLSALGAQRHIASFARFAVLDVHVLAANIDRSQVEELTEPQASEQCPACYLSKVRVAAIQQPLALGECEEPLARSINVAEGPHAKPRIGGRRLAGDECKVETRAQDGPGSIRGDLSPAAQLRVGRPRDERIAPAKEILRTQAGDLAGTESRTNVSRGGEAIRLHRGRCRARVAVSEIFVQRFIRRVRVRDLGCGWPLVGQGDLQCVSEGEHRPTVRETIVVRPSQAALVMPAIPVLA